MRDNDARAIVVGNGPAGLATAVALAVGGVDCTLVGKRPSTPDNRTTALLGGSVTMLTALGVWRSCAARAAPLRVMRIIDATDRLWRAPQVTFEAAEIGLDAFGYNIENRHLIEALEARARELDRLRLVESTVRSVACGERSGTVELENGERLEADLIVGADGRASLCRAAAGIAVDEHPYPQVALTLNLRHARPHRDTSTEFHTPNGPFTLVPLPGQRSSLVWVLDPADADELVALDERTLAVEVERAAHSILGRIEVESERGLFPLTRSKARRFAAHRVALVGESAHVIPPIGAQGLNLGLRDAAAIAELAVAARRAGRDIGGINLLVGYDRMRRVDVERRTFAVDLLNRSLLSDFLPVQAMRALGLYALDCIGPLRRALMREGLAPRGVKLGLHGEGL
jgi:2-octaprenyl-6-methoxyphenol hydroxylase